MSSLRFDGKVVIVTGAGQGLGRAYALLFATRGASVVVNDISHKDAASVAAEIASLGGRAVINTDSVVLGGPSIVQTALQNFGGRVDVIVNNASIVQNKPFNLVTGREWEDVVAASLRGTYSVVKAAWPHMQKQKFGRVINTCSAFGLYSGACRSSYSAASMGILGFTLSLAKEGAKFNITCNSIAPLAGTQMAMDGAPPALRGAFEPQLVAPFVVYLAHDSCTETGSIFEVGGGFAAKLRRERSSGVVFNSATLTPGRVAVNWPRVCDFASAQVSYPVTVVETDWLGFLEKSTSMKTVDNSPCPSLRFDNRVAIVTGAGGGLGRAYARLLGSLGASVVVNDVSSAAADAVVAEIKLKGGKAIANSDSVEFGEKIVAAAVAAFGGRIDVIVNNAGILRDKSFARATDAEWDIVIKVHLGGTFKVTRAAWPYMMRQKYGRIINTASAVGLYGNFGQTNYAAAKAAIIGFSNALAEEGRQHNILVNTIAPNAGTQMTATVMPPEMVEALKPDYIAPFVAFLVHDQNNKYSAGVYECGSGWAAAVRWQRAGGIVFCERPLAPEHVQNKFAALCAFDRAKATYPARSSEAIQLIVKAIDLARSSGSETKTSGSVDVAKALVTKIPASKFAYTERDVILYALGIGASRKDLDLVYEGAAEFHAIPSFGVILGFPGIFNTPFGQFIDGFGLEQVVHGEQYVELHVPKLPTSGTTYTQSQIIDIKDKGKAALVIVGATTFDKKTNQSLCYNEGSIFVRGHGGFSKGENQSASLSKAPKRKYGPAKVPKSLVAEHTESSRVPADMAAVYRLSGDLNPLHIDPEFAAMAGFPAPILHGLCSLGYGVRHVYSSYVDKNTGRRYPNVAAIQCRMTSHVVPGDRLATEMWQTSPTRVVFQMRDLYRKGVVVVGNASVDFFDPVVLGESQQKTPSVSKGEGAVALFSDLEQSFERMAPEARRVVVSHVPSLFVFDVQCKDGANRTWVMDMREGNGKISAVPNGTVTALSKYDLQVSVGEEDLVAIASGRQSAAKTFMQQQLKARGNLLMMPHLEKVFVMLQPKSRM